VKASHGKIQASFVEADMTPMIDIVFQLLTFFMIAINFENTKADERVKLPKDALAKPPEQRPKDELVLNVGFIRNLAGEKIRPEPVLFYNDEEVTIDNVQPKLDQERRIFELKGGGKKALDDVTVTIRADQEVPTGLIQKLIMTCQKVGFSKFSLKAEQED
jgi:biopolymer transport protein ExbD